MRAVVQPGWLLLQIQHQRRITTGIQHFVVYAGERDDNRAQSAVVGGYLDRPAIYFSDSHRDVAARAAFGIRYNIAVVNANHDIGEVLDLLEN